SEEVWALEIDDAGNLTGREVVRLDRVPDLNAPEVVEAWPFYILNSVIKIETQGSAFASRLILAS
ncbi:hypothetical protein LCGC14_3064770, partial [marine sediment metagenome]